MAPPSPHAREERIANGVYGTIATAATMSVVSDKRWDDAVSTSAQVLATVVVFWLAHAFAQSVGVRATAGGQPGRHDAMALLRNSWPIVAAAFPLLVPMLLVDAQVWGYEAGLWVSYGLAVVILASWGLVIGRRNHLGFARTAGAVLVSAAMGLLLITLKEIVH